MLKEALIGSCNRSLSSSNAREKNHLQFVEITHDFHQILIDPARTRYKKNSSH
jgi:hypothetical protein